MLVKIGNDNFDLFCGLRHYDGAKDINLYDKFSLGFFICLTTFFQR